MKQDKRFSSENLLMSVCGHLFLVALLLTSFALVIERAKLVAPDRVQIMEIDLSNVKITRNETSLYNTEKLKQEKFPETKKNTEPEIGEDKPIAKPSMVSPEKQKEEDKPKARTVVRVNRETANLNRTMTVSVVDALRVALTRCWVIDGNHPGVEDIRAVAHLKMHKNGMVRDVWFESAARATTDPAFSYVLETIKSALKTCEPFKMLPQSEFEEWEEIRLTFYPTSGNIM
jgi:hypothetical protein